MNKVLFIARDEGSYYTRVNEDINIEDVLRQPIHLFNKSWRYPGLGDFVAFIDEFGVEFWVNDDAGVSFKGLPEDYFEAVKDAIKPAGVKRLWLITINDNLDAIRFYQRRGFAIAAVHVGSLDHSRELKPSIPKIGQHGIPLRDEIEFEMLLG